MKKKLVSLLLAGSVVASMAAIASVSASAVVDANGCYEPGDNVEATHRYYFALPNTWVSEYSNTAGAYWWSGTDACGALDGTGGDVAWPGYKAQRGDYSSNNYGLFYVDCPTDVSQIIWSNWVDGGEDPEAPIYSTAKQTNDARADYYSTFEAADTDTYNPEWLAKMEEYFNTDKSKLGEFADNFFYDEEFDLGFSFNFDNMIFVAPPTPNGVNSVNNKPTYNGEWYFYFGDGLYGTYPTAEESEENGTLKTLEEVSTPDEPVPTAPTSTDPSNSGNKPGQPSTDPASATKPAATSDTPGSTTNGGAVQTGEASYAIILLVVLAAVSGVVVFTRKKYN